MSLLPVVVTKTLERYAASSIVGDLITSHGGLERVDGINLSDQHTGTVGLQRFSALSDQKTGQTLMLENYTRTERLYSFADVTKASNNSDPYRQA